MYLNLSTFNVSRDGQILSKRLPLNCTVVRVPISQFYTYCAWHNYAVSQPMLEHDGSGLIVLLNADSIYLVVIYRMNPIQEQCCCQSVFTSFA